MASVADISFNIMLLPSVLYKILIRKTKGIPVIIAPRNQLAIKVCPQKNLYINIAVYITMDICLYKLYMEVVEVSKTHKAV